RTGRARACADRMQEHARESYLISPRTLARLAGTESGLISTVRLPSWTPETLDLGPTALVLVADGIEYAGNLGSLIRTADACAADCLVLTSSRARRNHPKVFPASRGTVLSLPVLEFATVAGARGWLRRAGLHVVLADPEAGNDYREAAFGTGGTAVVVGSEGRGISPEWYGDAQVVAIPMLGTADSLNVATSAGILLYEIRRSYSLQNGRTSTDPKCATG
ncbi:MAG TPA: TrmH family RNA methyltransferase, partial [Mycobacteriales bacterium]|nr:TrmH family RNA methyltransferase [Mycobacteriales bacterium]